MTIAEKPSVITATRVDSNTLARLKVLSGEKPVARYLRELSIALMSNNPPSLDDLAGGESLAPIRKELSEINRKLSWLIERAERTSNLLDAVDGALTLTVNGYDLEVRRIQREQAKSDIMSEKFESAAKESPKMRSWRAGVLDGRQGVLSPGLVWNDQKNDYERNPDGTPTTVKALGIGRKKK